MRAQWMMVLVLGAPLSAPLGAQQPARAPVVRVQADTVTVTRTITRDTARLRALTSANESEVLRVVNELRAREQSILRALANLPEDRVAERRALEEALARASRDAFSVMSVIESRCVESRPAAPAGYIGLSITSSVVMRDRAMTVERAVVSSVEPGSPAERAGVVAGDLLVSIAGRDARQRIPELDDVLVPGRKLEVSVERSGRAMSFDVAVVPRPHRYNTTGCPQFERALQPLRMGGVARVWVQDSADGSGQRVMYVITPAPPSPPSATSPPTPPMPATAPTSSTAPTPPTPAVPPAPPMAFTFGSTMSGGSSVGYFAGAQFRTLDDDWRGVLGIKAGTTGVLVNEVAPGSVAAQSGLRVGDVVTHINGTPASSPFVAVRLLGLSEDAHATLKIVRAREQRTIGMRLERR